MRFQSVSLTCATGKEKIPQNGGMSQITLYNQAVSVELGRIPGARLQARELGNVQELSSSDAGL